MSRERAFGVPRSRGPLRTYRDCPHCGGTKMLTYHLDGEWSDPCSTCAGTGQILVDEIPATRAGKQAARVVAKTQGHGKPGRKM